MALGRRKLKRYQSNLVKYRMRYFSLIEIMVVIVIIGMVMGLVGPAIMNKLKSAKHKTAKNQCILLRECVNGYYLDMSSYPNNLEELTRNPGSDKAWNGPYITDGYLPPDPWGNEYHYEIPGGDGRAFDIHCYGADNSPGGEGENADVGSWFEEK